MLRFLNRLSQELMVKNYGNHLSDHLTQIFAKVFYIKNYNRADYQKKGTI